MGYHARIESQELSWFFTTRSRNSELWFHNNPQLENAVLGYVARFTERYSVKLYALAIEGNHIHGVANFPLANRASFMRDFNSAVARAVPRHTPEFTGGTFWARRYSTEILPAPDDIEGQFFYAVLQPVNDGLVERISEYPWYNCFHDAIYGIQKQFSVIHWARYNAEKARNSRAQIREFTQIVTLNYDRLPGYEHLPQKEYAKLMLRELEARRSEIVKKRKAAGLGFLGREKLLKIIRGSVPRKTKTSHRYSHRPRVLSVSNGRRAEYKAWYFQIQAEYQIASEQYRSGILSAQFPVGTYRPHIPYRPPPFTTGAAA